MYLLCIRAKVCIRQYVEYTFEYMLNTRIQGEIRIQVALSVFVCIRTVFKPKMNTPYSLYLCCVFILYTDVRVFGTEVWGVVKSKCISLQGCARTRSPSAIQWRVLLSS